MLPGILKKTRFSSYEDLRANYTINVPENFNFANDVVDKWANWDEDKLALIWRNEVGERREFTFADISKLSKKAANFLVKCGIKKGDKCMFMLGRRWEYWVCAVAMHRLGAILIPTSIQMTTKDIAYRVNSAGVKLMLCADDDYAVEQIRGAMPQCPTLKTVAVAAGGKREGFLDLDAEIDAASDVFERADTTNDDIMLLYFTSGTTGMPKMVAHSFTYPLGQVTTAKFWHQCQDGELHYTASDSGWAKFGWGCLYGQWICGSAILGYEFNHFNAKQMIQVIREERPKTFCVPPTIYRFLMKEGVTKQDFESVAHCSTAGEPLSPEIHKEFTAITGLEICEGYGQTESTVLCGTFDFFKPQPGSMGKPAPLYDIAVIDANGEPCPIGQEGELVIRNLDKFCPPGLLRGYYDEGNIISCYPDGTYHTGDMAWVDEKGYFWFVGRNDDMIKCSGYRIGPFEIESVLLTHPAVLECAITGAPDPIRGQVVKATIVLAKGYEESPELTKEIQNYVKKMTAPYKYPRVVEYVKALPKTTSGKISRVRIRTGDKA
ncbi:MAG: AMP-binding protein [Clostridia bacterium]|nr:AMP-binding protein [Clostridia bacterium]